MKQRDADIRARIATGDEDSLVNLMLYGTTFTRWPRATPAAMAASAAHVRLDAVMDIIERRIPPAIESPGGDERLQFVRRVIERQGIDVGLRSRDAARRHVIALRSRVLSENERYVRRLAAPMADESQRRTVRDALSGPRPVLGHFSPRRLCSRAGARRRARPCRAHPRPRRARRLSGQDSTSWTRRRDTTCIPFR